MLAFLLLIAQGSPPDGISCTSVGVLDMQGNAACSVSISAESNQSLVVVSDVAGYVVVGAATDIGLLLDGVSSGAVLVSADSAIGLTIQGAVDGDVAISAGSNGVIVLTGAAIAVEDLGAVSLLPCTVEFVRNDNNIKFVFAD